MSPTASSTNASTSSLLLPQAPSVYSATTIDTYTSADLSPSEGSQPEYVLAMHDYVPEQRNATCLAFRAGQVIRVLNRDPSGWWDGELDGNRGWFPSNYVNGDLALLTDGDLARSTSRKRTRHSPSQSTISSTSTTSVQSSRQNSFFRDEYCPPPMVPLLHALSLLQTAVRSNRIAHFQPSVACIISCVRSILAAVGCLSRDAHLLRQFSSLAQERKRVLSDLAAIVNQAKTASSEGIDEDEHEVQVEKMVRLGGQVFSRVRRFLAVAARCGVNVPDTRVSTEYPPMLLESLSSRIPDEFSYRSTVASSPTAESEDETLRLTQKQTKNAMSRTKARDRPITPRTAARARSMGDLRLGRITPPEVEIRPVLNTLQTQNTRALGPADSRLNTHKPGPSVSSVSSSSSFTSADSVVSPVSPPFPSGPSTYEELMEALRRTHNQYLSTIAAFIGHAHVHSRSSHAASTGYMYELVREIVEIVCKLLVVVEAVLHHPTVPVHKAANLKLAKDGLYNVISGLAESVRLLTGRLPPDMTEEQEKMALIRSATDAHKAGADCVAAVKMCLNRSTGEQPFIIEQPGGLGKYSAPRSNDQAIRSRLQRAVSLDRVNQNAGDFPAEEGDGMTSQGSANGGTSLRGAKNMLEETESHGFLSSPIEASSSSPVATTQTSDGRTEWESSYDEGKLLEDKIIHGNLPSVPAAYIPDRPPLDPDSWLRSHDYLPEDVAYNTDGHLVGATLQALVEKMTPHASIVDPAFSLIFFLTFRLFSTPTELVQAIIDRYNLVPPPGLSEERIYLWQQRKGIPVRLRVSNFIKSWLELYWRPSSDNVVLQLLLNFNRDALALMFEGPSQRLHEIITTRMREGEQAIPPTPRPDLARDPSMIFSPSITNAPSEIPRPIMTKTLFSQLRHRNFTSISIVDFDCLELARQLTIMECNLFCAIQPEEILESGQEGSKPPVNVRAVTSLSTVITGWVAESILNETDIKKRTMLVKFFIKLADRCTTLQNFATSRSILAALDSSTISRLQQTWMGVPQKQKLQLDNVRKLADHARNYHEYRSRLRETVPSAVPFLGLYLTDITFCREGNPSHRKSPLVADKKLINFSKYHKMARIIQDIQRFQVHYMLKEVPEIQDFLNDAFEKSKHHGDLQDLYRRSLLVEPRQAADTGPSGDVRQLFPWTNRSQATQPMQLS
ncbi:ras guanine nucleotide exchange factor domain-containing protein [Multifurca ochricompacta]|uniref:Ras guanine nucleotide exchange factor domain-containing protein n=1 Tax=Multifurca ochricompacta TaxID=376703 RepID=A0AAD4QMR3_9AGAM|nr:ras guanine nucleotide exchange factor domain-containing protein [Multifurca ochricompacta]